MLQVCHRTMPEEQSKPQSVSGYLLVMTAATLWGISGPLIRVLNGQGLGAMSIILYRMCISGAALVLYLLLGPRRSLSFKRSDLVVFLAAAATGPGLAQPLFTYTVTVMPVAPAVLIRYTSSAFTVILAAAFLREPLTRRKLLALALSAAGLYLILGAKTARGAAPMPPLGLLTGLGSAFLYAVQTIILKKISNSYHFLTVHLWMVSFSLPLVIAYNFIFEGGLPALPSGSAILPLLAVGLGSGLAAFLFYIKGLSRVQASRAAIVATWEPITAAVVGWLLLHELLLPLQIVGMGATLSGVIMAASGDRPEFRRDLPPPDKRPPEPIVRPS